MVRAKRSLPFRSVKRVDELGGVSGDNLNIEARTVLQGLAISFLETCFNRMGFSSLSACKSIESSCSFCDLLVEGHQGGTSQGHGER